eukprot:3513450-Pleurochrysis_carterae.AAC.1
MMGTAQSGPCRLCRYRGDEMCPRSAGCSRMNSAPASRAARRSVAVRSTSRFACSSSRRCEAGTVANPMMFSRSRTGGGPPSGASLAVKKRLTEKVEHGGDATTAA